MISSIIQAVPKKHFCERCIFIHECISIRGCALFSLWNSSHQGRPKTVENKGSNVRYNKINDTFPDWVIVENIIPRNMIINLGCASVNNHIPLDNIFNYLPIRECNIYILYNQLAYVVLYRNIEPKHTWRDFVCDHCNYLSTTGMVADQSQISRQPVSDWSPIVHRSFCI